MRRNIAAITTSIIVALALVVPGLVSASPAVSDPKADKHWGGHSLTSKPMSKSGKATLQAAVDKVVADSAGQVPGVVVGVWDPKTGWAVVASGQAVIGGPATVVGDHARIGSVTKTFVATEILKLVDAGKLKLSDKLSVLLPNVARKYPYVKDVTLAQLLGMTSRLPDYTEVPGVMKNAYEHPEKSYTPMQLIDLALSSTNRLADAPSYTNTNYIMLAEIAQRVTGKSMNQLVNANLRRLGMTSSLLPVPGQSRIPSPSTTGYTTMNGMVSLAVAGIEVTPPEVAKDDVTKWGQSAGAMYSTVSDLAKWAATGLGTSQLSTQLGNRRLASSPINGGMVNYGLGMEDFGHGWIGHNGQAIGWEANVSYNPKTGAALVILVNETGSLNAAAKSVAYLFPELVDQLS